MREYPDNGIPTPLRTVFLGTGDIGLPTLRSLGDHPDIRLLAVVTQPDKPAGRGRRLVSPPIKQVAVDLGLAIQQPPSLRQPDALAALAALEPDLLVVFAYGQILSRSVLQLPTIGCWNLHASLLPRHRGAAPIQAAIREGDSETGMTLMWMDQGLDTGDILCADPVSLDPDETGESLHDKLASLAPLTLRRGIDLLLRGQAPRQRQDAALATLTGKLDRADGLIDWHRSSHEIERQIRAHHPWPGSHTPLPDAGGERMIKVFPPVKVTLDPDPTAPPAGTPVPLHDRLRFRTGDGWLDISLLQPENSRRMSAADFLRGVRIP